MLSKNDNKGSSVLKQALCETLLRNHGKTFPKLRNTPFSRSVVDIIEKLSLDWEEGRSQICATTHFLLRKHISADLKALSIIWDAMMGVSKICPN